MAARTQNSDRRKLEHDPENGLFAVGIRGAEFGADMQKLGDDYVRIIRKANITVN